MGINIPNCPFCGCEFDIDADIEFIVIVHEFGECKCPLFGDRWVYGRYMYTEDEINKLWELKR